MEYTMEKLSGLLNMVSKVIQKEKTQKEEKQKRGEYFNIFSVLRLETKEVRLHSAFLAELLNPEGSHGLGKQFLELFLNMVVRKSKEEPFYFETENAKVHVEYYIGIISEDKKSGGRIDLLIEDGKGNAIIIENKINAGDQEYQLLRYNNFAKDKYKSNYKLLYLTKDGGEASEYSTGKENLEYICISYRNDILPWLECCEKVAVRHPLIRETIHQYIINLKEILNIMEKNKQDELISSIVKDEKQILSTIFLKDNLGEILHQMCEEKLKSICKDIALKYDMEIQYYGEKWCIQYCGVSFNKKEWKNITISFEFYSSEFKNFGYGIKFQNIDKEDTNNNIKNKLVNIEEGKSSVWYPWFRIDEQYPDWTKETAINALYDGKMKEHLEEMVERLLDNVNKYLDSGLR